MREGTRDKIGGSSKHTLHLDERAKGSSAGMRRSGQTEGAASSMLACSPIVREPGAAGAVTLAQIAAVFERQGIPTAAGSCGSDAGFQSSNAGGNVSAAIANAMRSRTPGRWMPELADI